MSLIWHPGVLARPRWTLAGDPVEPPDPPPSGGEQSATYTEDATTDFGNPERGWYTENSFSTGYNPSPVSSIAPANRLSMRYVRLDAYRDSALPAGFLTDLASEMASWRSTDCKAILRFAYNRSEAADASAARIQEHIGQLADVLDDYQDVIAVHQLGFVGHWAEWHSSTGVYLSHSSPSEMHTVMDALIDDTPTGIMAQQRYPWQQYSRFGSPLTRANRFSGSRQARWGLYNDCFCRGATNMGTYSDYDGTTYEQDRAYWAAIAPFVVSGGETCCYPESYEEVMADDWFSSFPLRGAPGALAELATYSWDYLHSAYTVYAYQRWQNEGNLAEISRRLGYRLVLKSATVPQTVTAGGSMSVTLDIENVGFGKVFNPRPIDLVFVGSGGPFTARMTSDARLDLPLASERVESTFTFTVPSGLVSSASYALHVRLPDPSTNLQASTARCIRLANTGIWDGDTGRHELGMSVTAA